MEGQKDLNVKKQRQENVLQKGFEYCNTRHYKII
jgi:hypothetical protein